MLIDDIRREQAMAEIIAQRDIMIMNQHAEMAKANEKIVALEAKIAAFEKKPQETKTEKE
jgi:hypothetical protein